MAAVWLLLLSLLAAQALQAPEWMSPEEQLLYFGLEKEVSPWEEVVALHDRDRAEFHLEGLNRTFRWTLKEKDGPCEGGHFNGESESGDPGVFHLCGEALEGVFRVDHELYHLVHVSQRHLVVRRDLSDKEEYICPHVGRRSDTENKVAVGGKRVRRSLRAGRSVIETAVFVDQALHRSIRRAFPVDSDRRARAFVLTLMSAVQLLFQQPKLEHYPQINLVLLDVLKSQPHDLVASDNIDTYLTNFCIWQHNKRHYGHGKNPHWDHALLLSGINMYVVDDKGRRKRHVVGLAPVSGMCNSLNSCTISEGTSFQTVLVAAHEMGHSLGMEHDGSQDGNGCNPENYIMSPTLGAGKTSWSACSKHYLSHFLRSPQAHCLWSSEGRSSGVNILDQLSELPGTRFSADQQCALRYGETSRHATHQPSHEMCKMLRCKVGYTGVTYSAHPALEGTHCGQNQWCRGGECREKQPEQLPVHGVWSEWGPYSACKSHCPFPVGLMISRRACNSPSPRNGGKPCPGTDKRAKLCHPTTRCSGSLSWDVSAVLQHIQQTCLQASLQDISIEPSGTQFPSIQDGGSTSHHSCHLWCHKRGGGYLTQGWKLPDGTPCSTGHPNHYCVLGECLPFDCSGQSVESAGNVSSSCTDFISLKMSVPEVSAECRTSCIQGASGFQLVTNDCNYLFPGACSKSETFQLCPANQQKCGAIQTTDQFANEICQRYRKRYPTVLSGAGRQLPPRPGNPDASCTVACQDRVWESTHYQMDAFEDGRFPFGTPCSGSSKHFCLNGRCLEFDSHGLPLKSYTGRLIRTTGRVHRSKRAIMEDNMVVRPSEWGKSDQWAITLTECQEGIRRVSVICRRGSKQVPPQKCKMSDRPKLPDILKCSPAWWQTESWGKCGADGIQRRQVLCIQDLGQKLKAIVSGDHCPTPTPLTTQTCSSPRL